MKKACKAQIKNKVESEKFKEKLNRCMEKKTDKYLKREDKAASAADRVTMKEQINALKEEKAEVKVSWLILVFETLKTFISASETRARPPAKHWPINRQSKIVSTTGRQVGFHNDNRRLKRCLVQSHAKRFKRFSSKLATSAIATTPPPIASLMPVWLARRRRASNTLPSTATQSARCVPRRTSAIAAPLVSARACWQSSVTGRHWSWSWSNLKRFYSSNEKSAKHLKQTKSTNKHTFLSVPLFYKFVNAK